MNKDVIYIEPEDDITDIITKIENSKEKIIALVPPKKASVFRSLVNLKLIAKAGVTAEKTVVLVTTDPSIIKLSAATKLPVTKDLKSAPTMPKAEPEDTVDANVDVGETAAGGDSSEEKPAKKAEASLEGESGFLDDAIKEDEKKAEKEAAEGEKKETEKEEKSEKKPKEKKEKAKSDAKNPVVRFVQNHKALTVCGGILTVGLAIFLAWALIVAPAAVVTVGIRTTTTNFSENVNFTEKLAEEDTSNGLFFLEEKKYETKSEVEFEATGTKNVGERASGTMTVYTYIDFLRGGTRTMSDGTLFTHNGKQYQTQERIDFIYLPSDGDDESDDDDTYKEICSNANDPRDLALYGCLILKQVKVMATASGESYNVEGGSSGWSIAEGVFYVSQAAISGGTDKTVTVVQQSDIDKAKQKIEASNESINKQKLLATIADDAFIIDASFKQTVGDAVSKPAVGEEVKEGERPTISVTTTDSIYIIDATKVEEFIREKAKLAENFKIYEMNDPFIENFTETGTGYVARLKTTYVSGPRITESDVAETVKGKGVGSARQDLEKSYDGISRINIQTSYPWVWAIPDDNNRITVNIEVDSQ